MIKIKADTTAEGGLEIDINSDGKTCDVICEMTAVVFAFVKKIKREGWIKPEISEEEMLERMYVATRSAIEEEKKQNEHP